MARFDDDEKKNNATEEIKETTAASCPKRPQSRVRLLFRLSPFPKNRCSPISADCVEFGYEYKNWVLIGTGIIFLISGIIAPLVYYKKSSEPVRSTFPDVRPSCGF